MNLFLLVVGVVVLINGAMVVALVRDVHLKAQAVRGRVGLSLVSSGMPASLTAPVRPSLVLVK